MPMKYVSMKNILRALAFAGCLAASQAHALCIACICTTSTASIIFGNVNPLSSSNVDSVGNVRVTCGGVASIGLPYTIALSAGTSGSMTGRQMANGTKRLNYNLYTNSSYSTLWGDGNGSTALVSGSFTLDLLGLAPPQDVPVYGRIPGGQSSVAPGAYTDTLVITLTYF